MECVAYASCVLTLNQFTDSMRRDFAGRTHLVAHVYADATAVIVRCRNAYVNVLFVHRLINAPHFD